MILVRPITVTREMIFSSNIEENDAPEWSSTVTYAEAQEVLYQHRVWESLIDGNLNHAPDTGALADPPTWLDLGPANAYRMFDVSPSTTSQRAESIEHVINPGRPIDALGFVNVSAASITVERLSPDWTVLWSETRQVDDVDALGSGEVDRATDVVFLGLPLSADLLRVTLLEPGGTARCGGCLIGRQARLGDTLFGASIGIRDFSRKDTDEYGTTSIVKRGYSKTADFSLVFDSARLSAVQRQLAAVRAEPTLFVGVTHRDVTIVYGFYRSFQLVISNPVRSTASIEVEGLTYEGDDALFPAATVETPIVLTPEEGQTVPQPLMFGSTEFVTTPANVDSHASSDWQLGSTPEFDFIYDQTFGDTLNKTGWTSLSQLSAGGPYYVRVRYRAATIGVSQWSAPVSFYAEAVVGVVNQPSIIDPASDGDEHGFGVAYSSSAFSYSGPADTHHSSDWQLASDLAFESLIAQTMDSQTAKTSWSPDLSPYAIAYGATAYVRVRHRGASGQMSAWSAARRFVNVDPWNGLGDSYEVYSRGLASATATAKIKFFPTGIWQVSLPTCGDGPSPFAERKKNGVVIAAGDEGTWHTGSVSGVDYEISIEVLSASGSYGGNVDEWLSLASPRDFSVAANQNFPTMSEANLRIRIRPTANPAAVQTKLLTLKAVATNEN